MTRVFLGVLGWVDQAPVGNRLRWSVPFDDIVNGQFIGLPSSVIVERSIIPPGTAGDTTFYDAPTFPIPLNWWEDLGDISVGFATPSRFNLPQTAQAIRFIYQGAETFIRVLDPEGTLVFVRRLTPGELVLIEEAEIAAIDFLIGGAVMLQTRMLDLFAGHDEGINYEQIAVLAPQQTTRAGLRGGSSSAPCYRCDGASRFSTGSDFSTGLMRGRAPARIRCFTI